MDANGSIRYQEPACTLTKQIQSSLACLGRINFSGPLGLYACGFDLLYLWLQLYLLSQCEASKKSVNRPKTFRVLQFSLYLRDAEVLSDQTSQSSWFFPL